MKSRSLTLPTLGAIAVTRAMLGAGAALLLSDRLRRRDRKRVGAALLAVGAATTLPIAFRVFGGK